MADDSISYEMLQDMLRTERRSNKLTPVPTRFWHDVREFLEEVMAIFRQEQENDPFSRKVMMATDEVKHARNAAEGIWALRERKMSLYALAQVREASPKRPEGLSPDEEKIFDHILTTLRIGRAAIIDGAKLTPVGQALIPTKAAPDRSGPGHVAAKPTPEAPPAPEAPATPAPERPSQPTPVEEQPAGPVAPAEPTVVPADTPDVEMVMIRAVSDIPAFVGPDMQTYLLKDGDIATVPKPIADLLERRKKAVAVNAPA